MFNENLKKRQPAATSFFEAGIKSGRLHHAYILTGSDIMEQYYLAMQTAKILNCQNKLDIDNCRCTNCSWINQNKHPAVITISPIDYTYGNDDSKGTTVISIKQARYLRDALAVSSQYKRVIIFTDAVEGKEYEKKAELIWRDYREILKPPEPEKASSDSERSSWIPMPITYETFHPTAPNVLLKTIEEPNPDIIFFFLTRDREDMLDTIVSRCQVISVPGRSNARGDCAVLNDVISSFPPKNHGEAVLLSEKFMEISKQESYSLEDLLDLMQGYIHRLVRDNHNDKARAMGLISFIEKIEKAKFELTNYVNQQAVIDSLFLAFMG